MGVVIERTVGGVTIYENEGYSDFYLQRKSKHNCRRCHGRGKLPYSKPGGEEWVMTCDCVHR